MDNSSQKRFPRFISNDSGVSLGSEEDDDEEIFQSNEYEYDLMTDAQLASNLNDDDKKFICENTAWAWHGEFGRLIMATTLAYNVDYRLMLFDARSICSRAVNAKYRLIKLDNAKAQFKCEQCGHCWTSMRARCSFYISKPDEGGIVLLKLYTQQCQLCYSIVQPLWYYDEICRVMKNLAFVIFKNFFPDLIQLINWNLTHNGRNVVKRLYQRKGYMRSRHHPQLCEACHYGFCY